jgi:outer membrane protein OmpA-like peptidoglycan-associated protein
MLRTHIFFLLLATLSASSAHAQWVVTADAEGALPFEGWAADAFGPGASGAVGVYRPITSWLLGGLRLRGGFLLDAESPDPTLADRGVGDFELASLAIRLRVPMGDQRHGTGFYVEGGGGLAFTGGLARPGLEAGIGFNFAIGSLAIGPTLRFVQVIEPDDFENLDDSDARIALAGFEIVLLDPVPEHAREAGGPGDRDFDGILDPVDPCPDEPEDFDEFEDEDGCPELDNDRDGIPDVDDGCPLDPEDHDGFADEDGCPDPDNDQDRILDGDDACPNEAETVNGVDDADGCPDEGLFEMVEDRIVLEERVLFDTDHWQLRQGAWPVLEAIVSLFRQHPEWARVRIEGHADYRGRDRYNLVLSERRATTVREALVQLGMAAEALESEGYGDTRPAEPGRSDRVLQRNRRVEFVVVERRERPAAEARGVHARLERSEESGE